MQAGHRDAEWHAARMQSALTGRERLHLRGTHLSIVTRNDVLKLNGLPVVSSMGRWREQTRRLIERKSYGNGAG
jgi:hypothetical protein